MTHPRGRGQGANLPLPLETLCLERSSFHHNASLRCENATLQSIECSAVDLCPFSPPSHHFAHCPAALYILPSSHHPETSPTRRKRLRAHTPARPWPSPLLPFRDTGSGSQIAGLSIILRVTYTLHGTSMMQRTAGNRVPATSPATFHTRHTSRTRDTDTGATEAGASTEFSCTSFSDLWWFNLAYSYAFINYNGHYSLETTDRRWVDA
jgi:hypothetical protein